MPIRKVIIPAGGFGTRLAPLTQLMPKEMLPVGGKVVLQHVLEECDAAGLDTALVVINRRKTALFPVGEETPLGTDPLTHVPLRSVYFANQELQGGLAHAILHGGAFVGSDHFAVALGDSIVHSATGPAGLLGRMIEAHLAHGAAATVAAQFVPDERISRYGVFDLAEPAGAGSTGPYRVRGVVEKPDAGAAPSRYAITARYVFSPAIFEACRRCCAAGGPGTELALTDAITHLAQSGYTVLAVPLLPTEQRLDIGNPVSYAAAFRLLSEA